MTKDKTLISKATAKKLIERSGAKRVSEEAANEMIEVLEKYADMISKKSIIYAEHAKRKTIKKTDIDLAKKDLSK